MEIKNRFREFLSDLTMQSGKRIAPIAEAEGQDTSKGSKQEVQVKPQKQAVAGSEKSTNDLETL